MVAKISPQEIPDWVLSKMIQYCTYQERSMLDVTLKLRTFHLQEGMDEKVVMYLKQEGYLDEARFAKVFASGKLRINNRRLEPSPINDLLRGKSPYNPSGWIGTAGFIGLQTNLEIQKNFSLVRILEARWRQT